MPYQIFYEESPVEAAAAGMGDTPRKEHYKIKSQAVGRVRDLFKNPRNHSILLAYRGDYVLSGFRLQFELERATDVSTT
jgi:hypothetical protein